MNRTLQLILAVTLPSTFAVACTDREATAPATVPGDGFTAAITCQATVSTGTLSCGSSQSQAAPGMNFDEIVGGPQGTYVTLASTGTAYDGTQAFTTNVTVQNHTAQPMATTDGTTPDAGGVKVFVHSGPTVTGGSGTVTAVGNATCCGTFTGTNQPYWQYSGLLAPGATSSSQLWRFDVDNTVTTFEFQVLVDTKLPAEASVLRWVSETPTDQTLNGVRMQCCNPTTGWAVGDNGTILHYDGTSWSAVNTNLALSGIDLYGVDAGGGGGGGCAGVVYIVGAGGTIVYSGDGGCNWAFQSSGVASALFSVSRVGGGSGSTAVFAVGAGGVILYSADGTTWSQQTSNTTDSLFLTGGPGANDWFAAGQGGTGLHWNGTVWSPLTLNTTASIHSGTGAGGDQNALTDIWLAGTGGTIVHSSDGVSWSVQRSGGEDLFGANGNGQTDQFAVGSSGTILHWNGVSWSAMASGSTANLKAVETSGGGGFVDVWAVGSGGTILHGIR